MKCPECGTKMIITNSRSIPYIDEDGDIIDLQNIVKDCLDFVDIFPPTKARRRKCKSCGLVQTTLEVNIEELKPLLFGEETNG